MGAYPPVPRIEEETLEQLRVLNVGETQIRQIWQAFVDHDQDHNGFFTFQQCLNLCKERSTNVMAPMLEGLFNLADRSDSGAISFPDFLIAFSCYCALNREEILMFLYMLIDADRGGTVSKEELIDFLSVEVPFDPGQGGKESAVQPTFFNANTQQMVHRYRDGEWKQVNFDEFARLCETFPYLPFPAFYLQTRLRKALLGEAHWERLAKERYKAVLQSQKDGTGSLLQAERDAKLVTSEERVATLKRDLWGKLANITMRDILALARSVKEQRKTTAAVEEMAEIIARSPLLAIVRNQRSAYYIPLDKFRKLPQQAATGSEATQDHSTPTRQRSQSSVDRPETPGSRAESRTGSRPMSALSGGSKSRNKKREEDDRYRSDGPIINMKF